MWYQQGDVKITKIDAIPEHCKNVKRQEKGFILAEGEATGHHHAVIEDDVQLFEKSGVIYLSVEKEGTVVHEEHGTVKLPRGKYQIGKIMEYDHFEEEATEVRD